MKKTLLILMVFVLTISCLSGCKKDDDIKDTPNISQPDNNQQIEITEPTESGVLERPMDVESAVKFQITEYIPIFEESEQMDVGYYEEILSALGAKMDPEDIVLYTYGEVLDVSISNITNTTVDVKIVGPDLTDLYLKASEIADTDEDIHSLVYDDLKNNKYSERTTNLTLNYYVLEDKTVKIEETEEYIDAIYGGLYSYYMDIYNEYIKGLSEEVENNE